jgi:putative membrane protein
MTLTKFARYACVAALLASPLAASAQNKPQPTTTTTPSKPGELSDTELQILAHLHHNDEMEVKAGQLAMQKGSTQAVKSFGKMLVDDHGANARTILAFVQKQNKTLPAVQPMNEADKMDMQLAQETMSKLNGLSGPDFDREFLRAQLALHEKTIAKLDLDIAKISNNPDLVQMLRGVRPVLVKHADKARTLLAAQAQQAGTKS